MFRLYDGGTDSGVNRNQQVFRIVVDYTINNKSKQIKERGLLLQSRDPSSLTKASGEVGTSILPRTSDLLMSDLLTSVTKTPVELTKF